MRPVKLTMKGIRSYVESTEIDFEGLDLFAVIGDTGAGKSTLIEAMVFALYAKKTWSGKLEELIAEGQNRVSVELVFDAGGRRWKVLRARGAGSALDTLESDGEGVVSSRATDVTERIQRLLGLDADQFMNAVLMRQGKFDELLTQTPTERNKILASIFDLGVLEDVREWVRITLKDLDGRRSDARGARQALPADPSAELEAAERERSEASNEVERLATWSSRLGERASVLDADRRSLERIGDRLAALPTGGREALAVLELLQPAAAQVLVDRAALLDAERVRSKALEELVVRLDDARQGFEGRDAVVGAAAALRTAAPVIDDAQREFATALQALRDLDALPAIDGVDPALQHAAMEAREREAVRTGAVKTAQQRVADGRALWQRLERASRDLPELVTERGAADRAAGEAKAAVAALDLALDDADLAEQAARAAQDAARRADAVAHVVQGCGVGDGCPVCDRPLEAVHLERHRRIHADDTSAVHEAVARRREVSDRRAAAAADESAAARRTAELQASLEALERSLESLQSECAGAGVVVTAADETAALADVTAALATAEEALVSARGEVTSAEAAVLTATHALEARRAQRTREREQLEERRDRATAAMSAARRRIPAIPEQLAPAPDATPDALLALAGTLEGIAAAISEIVEEQTEVSEAAAAARDERVAFDQRAIGTVREPASAAVGALDAWLQQVSVLAAELPDAAERASRVVTVGPVTSVGEIAAVHERAVEVVRVADALLELATAHADALSIAVADAESAISAILSEAGLPSTDAIREALGAARARVAQAERSITIAERHIGDAAALDAKLALLVPACADLETLDAALAPGAFVKHLVAARTAELLDEAGRRLSAITSGTYEFAEDFHVVQVRTGAVRRPEMLSGGERFQAALALSLALVEIAARAGGRIDAVFVDEGFGSLDNQALRKALDTLGGVAGDGKMVGLISHLAPVAEFVDTVFHVTKDDVRGSRIDRLEGADREALLFDGGTAGLTA